MHITTQAEYGLRCLMYLARHYKEERSISSKEISLTESLPKSYIEQLLLCLRHADLVKSSRGPTGGYLLARHPADITLREILLALEGETFRLWDCCHPNAQKEICVHLAGCGLRPVWLKLKEAIDGVLEQSTLADLLMDEAKAMVRLGLQTKQVVFTKKGMESGGWTTWTNVITKDLHRRLDLLVVNDSTGLSGCPKINSHSAWGEGCNSIGQVFRV